GTRRGIPHRSSIASLRQGLKGFGWDEKCPKANPDPTSYCLDDVNCIQEKFSYTGVYLSEHSRAMRESGNTPAMTTPGWVDRSQNDLLSAEAKSLVKMNGKFRRSRHRCSRSVGGRDRTAAEADFRIAREH